MNSRADERLHANPVVFDSSAAAAPPERVMVSAPPGHETGVIIALKVWSATPVGFAVLSGEDLPHPAHEPGGLACVAVVTWDTPPAVLPPGRYILLRLDG